MVLARGLDDGKAAYLADRCYRLRGRTVVAAGAAVQRAVVVDRSERLTGDVEVRVDRLREDALFMIGSLNEARRK